MWQKYVNKHLYSQYTNHKTYSTLGYHCTTCALQRLAEISKKALRTDEVCHSCKLHDDKLVPRTRNPPLFHFCKAWFPDVR